MKHKKYLKQVSAFMDGELAPDEIKVLQTHLKTCAPCRQKLEQMQKLRQIFAVQTGYSPNPFFATKVMAAARERAATSFWNMFDFIPKPVMNSALVVAALLFIIITFAPRNSTTDIFTTDYPIVSSSMTPSIETYDDVLEFAFLNDYNGEY